MLKFVLVVALFAALVYAAMWALEQRRAGNATGSERRSSVRGSRPRRDAEPTSRQVAPDDDEDFLRWLDRKRREDSPDQ